MDKLNEQLVNILQENSRRSNTEIAKALGVSEGTVRHRIKRLQEQGVIKRFSVVLGKQTSAVILIRTASGIATESISKSIQDLEVDFVLEMAGSFEIMCIVRTKNMDEINDVVEKIRLVKGVLSTQTLPVLKQY